MTLCARGDHIGGLVEDCSISIAVAMEMLQSSTKPLICAIVCQREIDMSCITVQVIAIDRCWRFLLEIISLHVPAHNN